jgi:hypothetical protein
MLSIRHILDAVLLLVKGILTLVSTSNSLWELEQGMQALTQQVAGKLMEGVLEAMDERLMA